MTVYSDIVNENSVYERNRNLEEIVDKRLRCMMKKGASEAADEEVDPELKLPEYYDPRKFNFGQQAFFNNIYSMMVAKLSGLLVLLALPSILNILMFTKQSSTPCTAFRRYVSTILHTFVWYRKSPNSQIEFFKSLKNVRRKHCIASKRSLAAGLGRISQWDMTLTQFGFIGFALLSKRQLGIVFSREEEEGLVHFWKVVGYLLGMKDKYNLCEGSVEECKILCRRLLEDVLIPCLNDRNPDFEFMGGVLIQGLWPVNPFLEPRAYTTFTLQLCAFTAADYSNNNHQPLKIDTQSLPFYSNFLLNLQWFVHIYLLQPTLWWSFLFRPIFNGLMRNAIFFTEYFPYLAYYLFGFKQSQVNIYKPHYE